MIGLLTGVIGAVSTSSGIYEGLSAAGIVFAFGVLAGAVIGRDRRSAALALAGAVLCAGTLLLLDPDRSSVFVAVIWGLGPGALLGAAAGRLWRHLRPQ